MAGLVVKFFSAVFSLAVGRNQGFRATTRTTAPRPK